MMKTNKKPSRQTRRVNRVASRDLLAEESRWIRRMRKCWEDIPESLVGYSIDTAIVICKRGVPSSRVAETVTRDVNAGMMLDDIHDDEISR